MCKVIHASCSHILHVMHGSNPTCIITTLHRSIGHHDNRSSTMYYETIDGRNLIFGHKLHIGTPYRGKRFLTHQIPTSCLPI
jgi:hypothetical protein